MTTEAKAQYDVSRDGALATRMNLCVRHAEARRALGWTLTDREVKWSVDDCSDCAAGPSVLERTIAEADAAAADGEPEPVCVLPGQRSLF